MLLADFLDRVGKLDAVGHIGLDDFADRLNFLFTVLILLVFSSVTTAKTYFLNPINCFVPNIVGSHEGQTAYITSMCYTDGLYNVHIDQFEIANHELNWEQRFRDRKIYYYQWLPFVFAVQGVAFYTPSLFWRLFAQSRASCDLWQLAKSAAEAQRADGDRREKSLRHVARQVELWLRGTRPRTGSLAEKLHQRAGGSLALCLPSKRLGTRLVWAYLAVKLMYIGNLTGQLLLMAALVRPDASASLMTSAARFSADLAANLATGADWRQTGLFPRSGCCAVALKSTSSAQMTLAQCALPVNMIHEKLFVFLWLWLPLTLVTTLISLCLWCARLVPASSRRRQLARCLRLAGALGDRAGDEEAAADGVATQQQQQQQHDKKVAAALGNFADDFIRPDGCLLLRLLQANCGDVAVGEICASLFRAYARDADAPATDAAVVILSAAGRAAQQATAMAESTTSPFGHRARRRSCSGSVLPHHHHHHHHAGATVQLRDGLLRQQQQQPLLRCPFELSSEIEAAKMKLHNEDSTTFL